MPARTPQKKSAAQIKREIVEILADESMAKAEHPSGLEWSDLAPTKIRVEVGAGEIPLENASAVEIRRDMNRRLAGFRAAAHVPARRRKWANEVYELAQARPWTMDQVPHDVWGLVLADLGRGTHLLAGVPENASSGARGDNGSSAHSSIATRDYEYVVYPEASHRNADRAVKVPRRRGKGPYDLTDAKREAKRMGAPAAIYSVSKGRFVGYIHPNGRYVTFR